MIVARIPCSTSKGCNFSFVPQHCSFKQLITGAGVATTKEVALRLIIAKQSISFDSEFFKIIVVTADLEPITIAV